MMGVELHVGCLAIFNTMVVTMFVPIGIGVGVVGSTAADKDGIHDHDTIAVVIVKTCPKC